MLNMSREYPCTVTVGGAKPPDQVTSSDVEFISWTIALTGDSENNINAGIILSLS